MVSEAGYAPPNAAFDVAIPDVAIVNATVFNTFTGEFLPKQSVWIKHGLIAYVGPEPSPPAGANVIDVQHMVVLPGLIDGHTHILNRASVEAFIACVIPTGVTTVITETIELGSILGGQGIGFLVDSLRNQPIRFFYTVAPLCGLTCSEEAFALSVEATTAFLDDSACVGLGEVYWGNFFLPGPQGERVRQLVAATISRGKRVEGHAAGARGLKLQSYVAQGISSCHEATREEEARERLRLGLWTMIRDGAIRKELESVQALFSSGLNLRRLILTTDGGDPESFLTEGYLDASVKRALRLGADPHSLYQTVTLNVAEHFRLDHLLGSVSPGKHADLVVIPSPETYSPQLVMRDGTAIFQDGCSLTAPRHTPVPACLLDTVVVNDLDFLSLPLTGRVRAIDLITRLVTKETIIDLDNSEESQDVLFVLALERRGGNASFMGYLKGFGLRKGAYGSTMCWDSSDMIVVGRDIHSMRTVINRLRETGGGAAFVIGSEVAADFSAPIGGIVSPAPMGELHRRISNLEIHLQENGVPWEKPLLTIDTLTTPAIPHLRITHGGYVRLRDFAVLSWKP
nr:adenine deaminase [Deltaproteobacteria bacterium]